MTRHRRRAVFCLLLLTGVIVSSGLWLRAERHQGALDRQLIAAVATKDTQEIVALLNQGASPNALCDPQSPPSLRQLLELLIHRTPLPEDDSPTVFLVVCGDTSTNYEYKAPDDAAAWQVEKAMLEHGANVNTKGQDGFAPLRLAVDHGNLGLARGLLEHGANVNARGDDGTTALYSAVWECALNDYNSSEYITLLLENGADPNLPTNDGHTVLQAAHKFGRSELAALLRQHGAKK